MTLQLHRRRSSTTKPHPNSACRRASMLRNMRNMSARIASVAVAMCCLACGQQGAAEIGGCHYSPHRPMLHKSCYINQWRVYSEVLGMPTILRIRGGRGPEPMARQSFDDSLVELVEFLRASSCNNASATAECVCRKQARPPRDSKNRTLIEGRIEEYAPNYESLSEMETEEDVEGAKDKDSQEEQGEEDLLARPARTVEEWQRQLDILYERQRDADQRSITPGCDCAYCLELKQRRPQSGEARVEEEDMLSEEEEEEEENSIKPEDVLADGGDETHLTREERRARDKQMYRHILFVRNLPRNITTDEMLEIFNKYGTVLTISMGARRETSGTAYILYNLEEEAQAAIRALSGFRLGDRYLVLQIHNPKRMFKVDKIDDTQRKNGSDSRKEGQGVEGEAQEDESGDQGMFLNMVKAATQAARGNRLDISKLKRTVPYEEGEDIAVECAKCHGRRI